jgi:hypothetical protein
VSNARRSVSCREWEGSLVTGNISVIALTIALVLFTAKHFLADFILQTNWMWRNKDQKQDWLAALAAHAGCHALLTLILALVLMPALWWLGIVDFAIHALIDRCRGVIGRRLGLTFERTGWWWLFGIDQGLHQLTHFAFVIALVAR